MTPDSANSSQGSPDAFGVNVRARDVNLLQSCTLSVWLGASDLGPVRSSFEPLPYSSPPGRIYAESTATAYHENHEFEAEIDRILSIAEDEGFEDGMYGRASESLGAFVSIYTAAGVQQLTTRLTSASANQGVAANVVRMLAQIKDERSFNDRVYIAECLLYSALPLARDAGAIALGDLANERSIPALRRAIEAESIPGLKSDMQASLDELIKDTHAVRSPEA